MSNRNGDKSRHHRQRKEKIRRRAAFAALTEGRGQAPQKKVESKAPKAASKKV